MRNAALLLLCACGSAPPDPPSVVVVADPPAVCLGDGFRTVVTLDGSRSRPRLTLVPVPATADDPPLAYTWSLSGAEHRVVEGGVHEPILKVTTSGDRPLHATLIARSAGGGEASTTLSVAVTLAEGACASAAPR